MLKSFHTFSAPHTNALSASIVLAISIGILFTHSGCSANPGGGATVLKSPDIVESGEPIELALHFTATGQRKGSLAKRFTKVMCHYEVDGTVTSESIAGTIVNVSENLMEMKFLIPTTRALPGSKIVYKFSFLFDGRKNARPGREVLVVEKAEGSEYQK